MAVEITLDPARIGVAGSGSSSYVDTSAGGQPAADDRDNIAHLDIQKDRAHEFTPSFTLVRCTEKWCPGAPNLTLGLAAPEARWRWW